MWVPLFINNASDFNPSSRKGWQSKPESCKVSEDHIERIEESKHQLEESDSFQNVYESEESVSDSENIIILENSRTPYSPQVKKNCKMTSNVISNYLF